MNNLLQFAINVVSLSVAGASNVPLLSTSELLKGILSIPHLVMFYKEEQKVTFGNAAGVNRLVAYNDFKLNMLFRFFINLGYKFDTLLF